MRKCIFHNGDFVLHNIKGFWQDKCSAWYDKDGNLKDAEQKYLVYNRNGDSNWHVRSVPKCFIMWKHLQDIGRKNMPTQKEIEEIERKALTSAT